MINWLKRLFSRSEAPKGVEPAPADYAFTAEERSIYYFFDGTRVVRADPIELWRKYSKVAGSLHTAQAVAASPSKDAEEQYDKMVGYIHEIFGTKRLAQEGGIEDVLAVRLLDHFLSYLDVLKKNMKRSATSPTTTSPATPPSSAEGRATSPSSATG